MTLSESIIDKVQTNEESNRKNIATPNEVNISISENSIPVTIFFLFSLSSFTGPSVVGNWDPEEDRPQSVFLPAWRHGAMVI